MGLSRQEYWSGLPCPPPGDLPDPGIEPASLVSPELAGRFFTTSATWEVWNRKRMKNIVELVQRLQGEGREGETSSSCLIFLPLWTPCPSLTLIIERSLKPPIGATTPLPRCKTFCSLWFMGPSPLLDTDFFFFPDVLISPCWNIRCTVPFTELCQNCQSPRDNFKPSISRQLTPWGVVMCVLSEFCQDQLCH